MQANQISAGQLMMGFMSKAKDDIREGIVANAFSKELLAQCNTGDGTGTVPVPVQGSTALLAGDSRASTSDDQAHPPAEGIAVRELKPAGSLPARNTPSIPDRKISEVKLREELYVSDPMVVEKILAHFQLPAEARAVCAGSLNSRGGVPFNTIGAVLEQYNPGGTSQPGEATAGSQEVAEFVAALQLKEGPAPSVLRGIPVKVKGSYSLKEFKLLMKKAVACLNEAELKKADLRDGVDKIADKSGGSPAAGAASSPASAPALAYGLSTQLVQSAPPMFVQPRERKAHPNPWEPVQNALSFPSSEEPSRLHDGTRIQAIGDPASLVMEPAMGETIKSDGPKEASPVPPLQVVSSDAEVDGLHQTKVNEVLQTLSARTASEEAAPYRLGDSNEGQIPAKEDYLQENHGKEKPELRSVHATGPSQEVFAPPAAEPSGTGVEVFPKDNRPLSRVDSTPPARVDVSVQGPDHAVEMGFSKGWTQGDFSQPQPQPMELGARMDIDAPVGRDSHCTEETARPYHAPAVVVGAGETVSARSSLEKNGELIRVEDLNVAQDSEISFHEGLSQREVSEVSTESGMEPEETASSPIERWSGRVSPNVQLEGPDPVEHRQPARMEVASPFEAWPSEPSPSEKPRGKPIPPQGAPAVEGAEKQTDEHGSFHVSEKSSHEAGHPETKRLDESAISRRGPEKFSESAPADAPAVFSEWQGNTRASSDDNRLDSLEVIPKQEPGAQYSAPPDLAFPHSMEAGSSEGLEGLSDMSGGESEEHNTPSRLERGPLGIDLANASDQSNTTFQDSARNWKRLQDPSVAGITEPDETIPDEAAASPKAPDASAPRFALETASSPLEPQKGPADSLPLEDAGWPQELGRRLTQLRGKDGNRLTLELAPKHLGKLVIQVEAHRDQVIAWLSTDNEQARSLLVQNAPLLRQQLQEQGLVLGQLQVSVGQEGREKNSQRHFEFSHGKGEGGRSVEKLQSGRRSGPTHAYRSADGDRRISLFA
ncbi:flagellar hook-length control protein FliK [Desulforhabdus sp. TSK]|uniref:flagellar hook-length control protein FliK n=1 Tax=Desulforhabdus sp. TSK TaxID=2925014 RepID=UPI001FC83FCD|nr:flagellar hook-length control protein FliK [Desulforhabdus sp. TSK]GKT07383.1 hypothetical protein DSTSK_06880 [Desulforhabdus sp. TSK]